MGAGGGAFSGGGIVQTQDGACRHERAGGAEQGCKVGLAQIIAYAQKASKALFLRPVAGGQERLRPGGVGQIAGNVHGGRPQTRRFHAPALVPQHLRQIQLKHGGGRAFAAESIAVISRGKKHILPAAPLRFLRQRRFAVGAARQYRGSQLAVHDPPQPLLRRPPKVGQEEVHALQHVLGDGLIVAPQQRAGGGVAEDGAGVGAGVVGAGKAAHHGCDVFHIMSSFCSRAYFLHPPRRKNKT